MKCILLKFVIWDWHLKFSGTRVIDIATWQQTGQSGVRILAGVKAFLFSKTSRLALGPTQPPIQWVMGLFPGIKCLVPRLTLDSWLGKYCPINLNVLLAYKGQGYSTVPCIFKISAFISTGLFFSQYMSFLGIKIVWNLIWVKIVSVGGWGWFFLLEPLWYLQQSWIIYRHPRQ
jgi:hypothetical protein